LTEPTKLFKDYFDEAMAVGLAERVTAVYPPFPAAPFVQHVIPQLPPLELKARVAVFTHALRDHLPSSYAEALPILLATLGDALTLEEGMFADGWFIMPIAYFVELYGLAEADFARSMAAMHSITQRHTAEFTIRPYLQTYPAETLAILHEWADDPSPHVRRLVSEGTRPRLPWAGQLRQFIQDPTPTLALLEKLKDDPELYVRKSVANHLNDIAKDHSDLVVATCGRWLAEKNSLERQWVVRHGLRTLIKAGHGGALALLGYGAETGVRVVGLRVEPEVVRLGEGFTLAVTLRNDTAVPQPILLDYLVDFVKGNGAQAAKVFKWTTRTIPPGAELTVTKWHAIRPITTRRYYAGVHGVRVQVNGQVWGEDTAVFTLII
jgi:3-methyladenine DNA glycosylase AlkC